MNSAKRLRTQLNESPMIYGSNERSRTTLNGREAHGMQGVRGSNPRTSTKSDCANRLWERMTEKDTVPLSELMRLEVRFLPFGARLWAPIHDL
jgi:hypothetical protein